MDSSKNQSHKDYYYILGVSPEATTEQIHAAYQELYDKFGPHVTLTGEDAEANVKAYKDIVDAYEVLSNAERRKEYDRVNLPLLQKSHLRDLWGKLTGVKADEIKTKDDLPETRLSMTVTLREAIKGCRKQLRIEDSVTCQGCVGKKPVDRTKCGSCRGSGQVRADRVEEIDIAPGTFEKQELRFAGKGKFDARSRKHSDLLLEIQVEQHPFFTVQGKDVSCTVPVTIYEAILGGEIEAPTPTGKVVMKIQPLTQRGRVYRLKGLGIAGGDLLVSIEVLVPSQLHADEVELFRKLHVVSSQPNPRHEIFAKLAAATQSNKN
jgi:DnaJ-class molecular chaperone